MCLYCCIPTGIMLGLAAFSLHHHSQTLPFSPLLSTPFLLPPALWG